MFDRDLIVKNDILDCIGSLRGLYETYRHFRSMNYATWPIPGKRESVEFSLTEYGEIIDAELRQDAKWIRTSNKTHEVNCEIADTGHMIMSAIMTYFDGHPDKVFGNDVIHSVLQGYGSYPWSVQNDTLISRASVLTSLAALYVGICCEQSELDAVFLVYISGNPVHQVGRALTALIDLYRYSLLVNGEDKFVQDSIIRMQYRAQKLNLKSPSV